MRNTTPTLLPSSDASQENSPLPNGWTPSAAQALLDYSAGRISLQAFHDRLAPDLPPKPFCDPLGELELAILDQVPARMREAIAQFHDAADRVRQGGASNIQIVDFEPDPFPEGGDRRRFATGTQRR